VTSSLFKTPQTWVHIHPDKHTHNRYNTYKGHYKENECMRQVYEPLLVKYSVDILVLGHIHSYERCVGA
jgi:UDP-2,3-diacylglucosamine pyrophosphatase LpxH